MLVLTRRPCNPRVWPACCTKGQTGGQGLLRPHTVNYGRVVKSATGDGPGSRTTQARLRRPQERPGDNGLQRRTALPSHPVLALQRSAGNHAVASLLRERAAAQRQIVNVQRDTGRVVGKTPFHGDGRHKSDDAGYAATVGQADAVHLRKVGTLSDADRMEINGKLSWFDGKAHDAYEALVKPVLTDLTSGKTETDDSEPFTDAQLERMGQAVQVNNLIGDFTSLKEKRIATWKSTADAKEPKPARAILDMVVAMVALGMGGVFGEIIAQGIKGKLLNEFVLLAGLELVDKAALDSYEWAMHAARDTFQEGTVKALDGFKDANLSKALSADSDDLIAVYAEAMSLQAGSEKMTLQSALNRNSKVTYRKGALTLIGLALTILYNQLYSDPKVYHRELTEGFLRMMDEAHVEKVANKGYGGDKARARREDKGLHETDDRKGNLTVLSGHPSYSLGNYWAPALGFASYYALGTGANTKTLMKLANTPVRSLNLTLGFRHWGTDPFYRILYGGNMVHIWYTRDPGGDIHLDPDVGEGAKEWLASYFTGIRRELTDDEREANALPGAKKLYDATNDKPIGNLSNFDLL